MNPAVAAPVGRRAANHGFTLFELLVVAGLIGALAFFILSGFRGGTQATGLASAQATMANLLTSARMQAAATGRKSRVLINVDPLSPDRFLRHVLLQLALDPGPGPAEWETIAQLALPDGIYVVPASHAQFPGVTISAGWKRISDPTADLVSDLLANQAVAFVLPGEAEEQTWTGIAYTPNGMLAALGAGPPPKGFLVMTIGVKRAPGDFGAGESPIRLPNPQAVRGILLSVYGVPALLNDRTAF